MRVPPYVFAVDGPRVPVRLRVAQVVGDYLEEVRSDALERLVGTGEFYSERVTPDTLAAAVVSAVGTDLADGVVARRWSSGWRVPAYVSESGCRTSLLVGRVSCAIQTEVALVRLSAAARSIRAGEVYAEQIDVDELVERVVEAVLA